MITDSFIGSNFNTPKGGVLTVIDVDDGKGCNKKYFVTCSICSSDKELYPEPFKSPKGSLVKGAVPCGCALNPKRTPEQGTIIVKKDF